FRRGGDHRQLLTINGTLPNPAVRFGPLNALQPSRTYGFEYVVGFDLSTRRKSLRGSAIVLREVTAPQRAIAQSVNGFLATVDDNSWETCFCNMMDAILTDKETDPLLKIFLLKKVLAVGCKGSVCLQKGFSRYTEVLGGSDIPAGVNWIDPDDPAGDQNRPIARAILAKLPDFIAARDATDRELRALLGPIGTKYQCIGWLRRKQYCLTLPNLPKSGKLFVVRKDKETFLEPVGHLDQDKATIDAAPGSVLLEGRPVYLAKPPSK
ncbi:MAG: hypothetical protein WCJ35_27585, partial [Planctomycetota bacterium]